MSEALLDIATLVGERMPSGVESSQVTDMGELVLTVDPQSLLEVIEFLKIDRNLRFTTLIDITAVDYPDREKRFEVVYHFLSMYSNARIRLKYALEEDQIAPSITSVHPAANWFEREVFDLFGILFSGHPDLRRILTDYGFSGHPLRKDFPTTGYVEVRYDEAEKRVVYEPVKLTQEYRQFDFMSPWEGAEYILPGDENAEAK
ncbi:MAG: NADH-quinone oxidoreductase subunit C [Pseudomonadota bacterium]